MYIYLFKESSDIVTSSTNPVSYTKQSDESKSPKYENTSETAAEPNVSKNLEDPVDQTKEELDTQRVTDNLKVNLSHSCF